MITHAREAMQVLRKRGIMTMTRSAGRPSLVEEVAGGRVKGSWWGHAKGGLIFTIAEFLHDSREVLTLKLIDGKVTFVHKSLWPALARLVMDRHRRREEARKLSPDAGRLLRAVERSGSIRTDRNRGRKELELALLVHSGSVHTGKGNHATVLTRWSDVFDSETLEKSRRMSLDDARGRVYASPPSHSSTGLPSESRT